MLILSFLKPYYYNDDIHNFGNIGGGGLLHASVSPLFTKFIDFKAYNSVNIREQIYENLEGSVLDMCCGTGYSTKPNNVGIDTSNEMLNFANIYNSGSVYKFGNAETFGNPDEYDYVTCMFSFHEMPRYAHILVIKNAKRVAKKGVIILDIATNYKPKRVMLAGEPYILDYLNTIDDTMEKHAFNKQVIVPSHAEMWTYIF
jgi:SAM-dependent methyltransferase